MGYISDMLDYYFNRDRGTMYYTDEELAEIIQEQTRQNHAVAADRLPSDPPKPKILEW